MELVNLTVNIIINFFFITGAGQEKTKRPLLQWTREIVNHFWFCADTAETENEFIVSMVQNEIS